MASFPGYGPSGSELGNLNAALAANMNNLAAADMQVGGGWGGWWVGVAYGLMDSMEEEKGGKRWCREVKGEGRGR